MHYERLENLGKIDLILGKYDLIGKSVFRLSKSFLLLLNFVWSICDFNMRFYLAALAI